MPPDAASDLANRRPVWLALSSLYLDTERTPLMREADAKRLALSPYTLDELRTILTEEVHPACARNLLSPAGEWAGFDEAWLEQQILSGANNRPGWLARLSPLRRAIQDQAEALFARVRALRHPDKQTGA